MYVCRSVSGIRWGEGRVETCFVRLGVQDGRKLFVRACVEEYKTVPVGKAVRLK